MGWKREAAIYSTRTVQALQRAIDAALAASRSLRLPAGTK